MLLFVPALICSVAYVVLRRRDRRMLRNGILLFAALVFAVLGVVDVSAHRFPVVEVLLVAAILLFPVGLVVLAAFLLANGVRMFRREGRSVGNMLSFIAGAGVIALVAIGLVLVRIDSSVGTVILLLVLAVAGYFGVVFVVFLLYALVYGRIRFPPAVDVVVVLGSGLVRGQVPPLLRSRLDKGIDVYRRSVAVGREPIMIPSGGQGSDEPRPEATAMAEYLIAQGVPADRVHPETASRNTAENLRFSRRVQEEADVAGTVIVVTNNYHVMRSAMLARSLGSDAQVVGAPTARYYVPSAFLREFLAVTAAHRVAHACALAAVLALGVVVAVLEVGAR